MPVSQPERHNHSATHSHSHSHAHALDHGDHVHEERQEVEQRAVELEDTVDQSALSLALVKVTSFLTHTTQTLHHLFHLHKATKVCKHDCLKLIKTECPCLAKPLH